MSLAACNPSSFKFRSIKRLLAAAARSSADCAHPIIRIASEQNVLKSFILFRPHKNVLPNSTFEFN